MDKIKELVKTFQKKKLTLSVAESCSGGYVSYLLTKVSGSSDFFKGGVIVYSLESKNKFFKIPFALLRKTQGVSDEVASLLAKRVKGLLNSDMGASIVGFAGPKGQKVGTIYLSVSYKKTVTKKLTLKGGRDLIRKQASSALINLILGEIKNADLPHR
ncbi:MAG: CinA family protein [Candidatus Omnitrophica bacterium]|nr:CinA family protein [Candidatus Omnitrophota bacterium]